MPLTKKEAATEAMRAIDETIQASLTPLLEYATEKFSDDRFEASRADMVRLVGHSASLEHQLEEIQTASQEECDALFLKHCVHPLDLCSYDKDALKFVYKVDATDMTPHEIRRAVCKLWREHIHKIRQVPLGGFRPWRERILVCARYMFEGKGNVDTMATLVDCCRARV